MRSLKVIVEFEKRERKKSCFSLVFSVCLWFYNFSILKKSELVSLCVSGNDCSMIICV